MQMPRATDEVKERFRDVVPAAPDVAIKPMFGQLGAFVNGNMFAGLFGSAIGVKLAASDAAELAAAGGGPFGPAERPMGGYVALPADWSAEQAAPWIERSRSHVAALPPKKPKKKT